MDTGELMLLHLNNCNTLSSDIKYKLVSLGFSLLELSELFKIQEVKDNWESFEFYKDNLGFTNTQIKEAMLIAKYLKEQTTSFTNNAIIEKLHYSYLYELAKNNIKLTNDMVIELEGANYNYFKSICKTSKKDFQN